MENLRRAKSVSSLRKNWIANWQRWGTRL